MDAAIARHKRRGYGTGSILRIRMVNFLTYDECDVFPGPKLNVLIGPNGTGKSSISAAICLALCGSPKLIGRSTDLSTFVNSKSDKDDAYIEVDLLGENEIVTIRRDFSKRNQTSKFKLNNSSATKTQVQQVIKDLRITFDNLCAYMPQDRVGEFTTMNGKELLEETLKVVQNRNSEEEQTMFDEMQSLAELEVDAKHCKDNREEVMNEIERLRAEIDLNRPEYERQTQRQIDQRKKSLYEKKKCWIEFQEKKKQIPVLKSEREKVQSEYDEALIALDPIKERLRHAEIVKQAAVNAVKTCRQQANKRQGNEDWMGRARAHDDDAQAAILELKQVERNREQSQAQLAEAEAKRAAHCADLHTLRGKMPALDDQVASTRAEMSELMGKRSEVEQEARVKEGDVQRCNTEAVRVEEELRRLADTKEACIRHLSSCGKLGNEAIKAMKWVEENRNRFTGEVRGPVALELHVENEQIAAMVEKQVPFARLMSFVCETQEDLETLRTEFRERNRWGLDVYKVLNCRTPSRPHSPETMQALKLRYGIQGYLDENIRCHRLVSGMLNAFQGLHQVTWAETKQDTLEEEALSALMNETTTASRLVTVYALTTSSKNIVEYNLRKSKYSNSISSNISQVSKARTLGKSEDTSAQRQQIENLKEEIRERKRVVSDELRDLRACTSALTDQINAKQQILQTIAQERNRERTLIQRIELVSRQIESLQQTLSEDVMDIIETHKQALRNSIQETKNTLQYWLKRTREGLESTLIIQAKEIEASVASRTADAINHELHSEAQKVKEREHQLKEADERLKALKNEIRELSDSLKTRMAVSNQEEFNEMKSLEGETVDEVNQKILELEVELERGRDNDQALVHFEKLRKDLAAKEQRLAAADSEVNNAQSKLEKRMQNFETDVEIIVEKLNALFAKFMSDMGYKGEVLLTKEGLLTDWKVKPLVAFRASQELSELSAHRNSGGERAVSTIMYLMSMQDLGSCPVRIVDEINQGMDERNERLVFERIVDCTSDLCILNADGSDRHETTARRSLRPRPQYFYITPKLLQAMTSMDRAHVTVLLVLNGPGLLQKPRMSQLLKILSDLPPGDDSDEALNPDLASSSRSSRKRSVQVEQEDPNENCSYKNAGKRRKTPADQYLENANAAAVVDLIDSESDDEEPSRPVRRRLN